MVKHVKELSKRVKMGKKLSTIVKICQLRSKMAKISAWVTWPERLKGRKGQSNSSVSWDSFKRMTTSFCHN